MVLMHTPAAEWLHRQLFISSNEQIREIRSDLPPGYYRQLPKLARWSLRRISARVRRRLGLRRPHRQPFRRRDAVPLRARLSGGAAAHDRRALGVAITLRIVLVENLRRLAKRIVHSRAARGGGCPGRPVAGRPNGRAAPSRSSACSRNERKALAGGFAVQLVPGCATRTQRITPALTWLEERLAAQARRRTSRARRTPAAGRRHRHGAQHHHQHAPDLRRRLDRSCSSASAWSTRCCRRQRVSRRWISRRAISTAAPSRNWRAARSARSSTIAPRAPAQAAKQAAAAGKRAAGARAIPAIICSPAGAAPSKRKIGFRTALRRLAGRFISESLGIGGYVGDHRRRGGPCSPPLIASCAMAHRARPLARSACWRPRRDPAIDAGGRAGQPRS
jgi:cyclic beta-1,2-glucan synthetase